MLRLGLKSFLLPTREPLIRGPELPEELRHGYSKLFCFMKTSVHLWHLYPTWYPVRCVLQSLVNPKILRLRFGKEAHTRHQLLTKINEGVPCVVAGVRNYNNQKENAISTCIGDYLEGQRDLVSRLITPATSVITLVVPTINPFTKRPDPPSTPYLQTTLG